MVRQSICTCSKAAGSKQYWLTGRRLRSADGPKFKIRYFVEDTYFTARIHPSHLRRYGRRGRT